MYHANHLAERLRAASLGRDDAAFLQNPATGQTLTYGAFFANAERMAAVLRSYGVEPGDRVAVQAPKTQAMLELYVGAALAGAVFVPLNPAYTVAEISYFLTDAGPKLFVCDPARKTELQDAIRSAGVARVLTLNEDETGSLTDARDIQVPGFDAAARDRENLAAILYTSGTTGRSKGAMLSHRALASNSRALRDLWQFGARDVLIHALPIFHTHGLFVATNVTLMSGGSCIFNTRFDAGAIVKQMPAATAMMGVPTFYTRLLDQPGLAAAATNMRLFVSGSAPLLAETHRRWQEVTGHAILERYGMTETNMNTSNPFSGERRPGTVGRALPGVEVNICDPTGADLAQGETGMIEVSGPNLFSGYWQMPEKTAEELRDSGFFITGDLGRFDEDGYLHIVGRGKDLIISGGFNIYPKEIELLIDDLPDVLESAVIGVPHPDFGEAVVAVVVRMPGATDSGEDILAKIAHNLSKFKQPKLVQLVDSLPRNTMGKVQKNQLRERFGRLFS